MAGKGRAGRDPDVRAVDADQGEGEGEEAGAVSEEYKGDGSALVLVPLWLFFPSLLSENVIVLGDRKKSYPLAFPCCHVPHHTIMMMRD